MQCSITSFSSSRDPNTTLLLTNHLCRDLHTAQPLWTQSKEHGLAGLCHFSHPCFIVSSDAFIHRFSHSYLLQNQSQHWLQISLFMNRHISSVLSTLYTASFFFFLSWMWGSDSSQIRPQASFKWNLILSRRHKGVQSICFNQINGYRIKSTRTQIYLFSLFLFLVLHREMLWSII